MRISINITFSMCEIFSRSARARVRELKKEALEVVKDPGDVKRLIGEPTPFLPKPLRIMSANSPEEHKRAMDHLGRIKYNVGL